MTKCDYNLNVWLLYYIYSLSVFHIRPSVKTGVPIWYTGNWRDKAGGYGIQEPFGMFAVKSITGDYNNIVGLPISRLLRELDKFKGDL